MTSDHAPDHHETRERILRAATECFAGRNSRKVSLQEIAERAGLSRQTVYRYFATKEAIVLAVEESRALHFEQAIARANEAAESLEDYVTRIAFYICEGALAFRTRERIQERDESLQKVLFFERWRAMEQLTTALLPKVEVAHREGQLAADVSILEAAEWIALALSGIASAPHLKAVDVNNAHAHAAFMARRACRSVFR